MSQYDNHDDDSLPIDSIPRQESGQEAAEAVQSVQTAGDSPEQPVVSEEAAASKNDASS